MDADRCDYQLLCFLTHRIKLDSESELGESEPELNLDPSSKNESEHDREVTGAGCRLPLCAIVFFVFVVFVVFLFLTPPCRAHCFSADQHWNWAPLIVTSAEALYPTLDESSPQPNQRTPHSRLQSPCHAELRVGLSSGECGSRICCQRLRYLQRGLYATNLMVPPALQVVTLRTSRS